MPQLTEHFSLEEFTRSDTASNLGIDNSPAAEHMPILQNLANCMEGVRALFNKSIRITSGYRSPAVNDAVGGSKTSAHSLGHAADFHVAEMSDLDAAKVIRDSGLRFDQLIYEKGRCVHISFDPDRMRQEVLRQPGGPGSQCFPGLEE